MWKYKYWTKAFLRYSDKINILIVHLALEVCILSGNHGLVHHCVLDLWRPARVNYKIREWKLFSIILSIWSFLQATMIILLHLFHHCVLNLWRPTRVNWLMHQNPKNTFWNSLSQIFSISSWAGGMKKRRRESRKARVDILLIGNQSFHLFFIL